MSEREHARRRGFRQFMDAPMTDDHPTPAAVCPRWPSPPPRPYRTSSARGMPLIVHPGVCYVCRKPPHPDRPDHRFEPAVESPDMAARLGWI